MEAGRAAGYKTKLITVEVGSRGMLDVSDFEALRAAIDVPRKEIVDLFLKIIKTTILESFRIWGSRNCAI